MSVCPQGGYPYPIILCNITQNSMGQIPGGYPARSSQGGTLPGGYPARGVPCWGVPYLGTPPGQVRMGGYPAGGVPCQGGYPVRITEGVLTTQRAVCLLRSRRRTFLFMQEMNTRWLCPGLKDTSGSTYKCFSVRTWGYPLPLPGQRPDKGYPSVSIPKPSFPSPPDQGINQGIPLSLPPSPS